jgi:hypothetical protein
MDRYPFPRRESREFGSGIKTAVVVVVLGTLAAVADHAFFVAPHAAVRAVVADAPAAAPAAVALPSGLPSDLRPTVTDADTPAPTF